MKETIKKLTFKDVHAELEAEHVFLKQNHDISSFEQKANFLNEIGFQNSIAAKLYTDLSKNNNLIKQYNRKYKGVYKFKPSRNFSRGLAERINDDSKDKFDCYLLHNKI